MTYRFRDLFRSMALAAALCAASADGRAATTSTSPASAPVNWSATSSKGVAVSVPAVGKPSLLTFVRMDQPQSQQALQLVHAAVEDSAVAQILIVVSGQTAQTQAEALDADGERLPIIIDADYDASGAMQVHVWPTVVIVRADGQRIGHLAGLPKSFAKDLEAYLALAGGTIDQAELDRRLTTREVVADSAEQSAARRLQVADRLLAHGEIDQAKAELEQAMTLAPDSPAARVLLAKAMLMSGQPDQAIALLDQVSAGGAPAWQLSLLRAKALMAQDKWDQARPVVPEALKLNPEPAEAHYLSGLVHEHDQEWQQAAQEYRRAFESASSRAAAAQP
jgi:tetratricopeptide (TPR) repeat protein